MKIGIYGGTFNPPHLGHLTAAAAVIATLKLDKLLLIPASIPPHKDLPAGSATAEQRLEMTRMAGEHLGLGSKVETLDMEVRRAGKSFTSDTLAELKAQFPEDELWLLMGTDMFLSFETWHEPEKIASLAGIAAFGRTKADMEPQFSAQRDKLYRLYPDARIFTLTVPGVIDISSTELRERLASGTGENLLDGAQSIVETALDRCVDEHVRDWNSVKTRVREALSSYIYRRTKRSPMILPILMEV